MPECDIIKCKICGMPANILFEKTLLFKYRVGYFRCPTCEFLFTEKPYWLQEAYDESIKGIRDTGMVRRNMNMSDFIEQIIMRYLNPHGVFVDYGAGTGLLVRMMRDKGFKYYYSDPIAKNIFARGFDVERKDLQGCKFDLLTALEVFEHSTNPVNDLRQMFGYSDSILFTTELQPVNNASLSSWSYLLPESGQHIAFYTQRTLRILAEMFSASFQSDGRNTHFLTTNKGYPDNSILSNIQRPLHIRALRKLGRLLSTVGAKRTPMNSLITEDFIYINSALENMNLAPDALSGNV